MKRLIILLFAAIFAGTVSGCGRFGGTVSDLPAEGQTSDMPLPDAPEREADTTNESEFPPTMSEEEPKDSVHAKAEYVQALVDGLHIRTGAGTEFPSLGQAEKGCLLSHEGTENGWHRTRYRGREAYVSANETYTALISLDTGDGAAERVISEGVNLLGVPYVYGAVRLHDGRGNFSSRFTSEAFDCSSLMQYIFFYGADILLDVTTRTQIFQGVPVEEENIARGDLLFFTNASRQNKTGIERVGHVALYLGGNYILHTSSDYAKIEQISPARRAYFLQSRRVL